MATMSKGEKERLANAEKALADKDEMEAKRADMGEKIKRTQPPRARVKSAGKVSRRLDSFAKLFKENNPGQDCRWVFDPAHKPDMSNVYGRQADGYAVVSPDQLGPDFRETSSDKKGVVVRVGDVILMSIAEDIRTGYQKEQDDLAADELSRVNHEFHESIDEVNKNVRPEHRLRPRGSSVTEAVEREVNLDPSLVEGS